MSQQHLTTTDKEQYQQLLDTKVATILSNLQKAVHTALPEPAVYPSKPVHYRMRAEFAIYFDNDTMHYVMYKPNTKPKERIFVDSFDKAHEAIYKLMPDLSALLQKDEELKHKLFEIDFLTNQKGDVIVSLIYHKKLDETATLRRLEKLRDLLCHMGHKVSFTAHAKKQLIKCPDDTIVEEYKLKDGNVSLYQVEGTFTQPNATTCSAMLEFARECSQGMHNTDLLELYCGSGTFTTALAPYYRQVLATEVARVPTQTALKNLRLNHIDNTKLVRLSALEVTQALNKERSFNRLNEQDIDLDSYNFKTLLIDPPRAGLASEEALSFTARFDRVIYISCGPESFASDLSYLIRTHDIVKLSFFDQFPYTSHLESGALLVKRGSDRG